MFIALNSIVDNLIKYKKIITKNRIKKKLCKTFFNIKLIQKLNHVKTRVEEDVVGLVVVGTGHW